MNAASRLRTLLASPEMVITPGAYDCLSAMIVKKVGFDVLFVGSFSITSAQYALPDTGLVSPDHLIAHARNMYEASELPTICDLDDAGGTPLKAAYNIKMLERAGLAGFQMEDADLSHGKYLPGRKKQLISVEKMVDNIKAVMDARRNADTVAIIRTDARDCSSLGEAVDRCGRYSEEGADLVLVPFLTIPEIPQIIAAVKCEMAHLFIPSDKKDSSETELVKSYGVKLLIHAASAGWAAALAVRDLLVTLRNENYDATQPVALEAWSLLDELNDAGGWGKIGR